MSRVLVTYEKAQEICGWLTSRFSGASFRGVENPAALRDELSVFSPEVVFSIKSPNFPGEEHRPALQYESVRWFQIGGSGYEHLGDWNETRVQVTNCAGVLAPHLAETLTGAMIALNGNFLTYYRQQAEGVWLPHEFRPLSDQVLLVVGLGNVGRRFAQHAKALGMRVLGIRREPRGNSSVDAIGTMDDYAQFASEADVVSLHLRANAQNRHLFDRGRFEEMKAGALFMNTARGSIVHEASLVDALRSGHLRAAYLDVFQEEPMPADSDLWRMPNVMITPHASDNVYGWPIKFADFFASNLQRWTQGKDLQNVVNLTRAF
jgi:phosphoglycerate dehydrogenase-like enzyme